jgi:hypothetical protein
MRLWWVLQDVISDSFRAVRSIELGTFFAILSSVATVCAAGASFMSYMVSRDSQKVADESLAITKAIDLRNQLQQRALVTVRNATVGQYGLQNAPGSEVKVVTTISLNVKNSGHNPAGWIRLRGGDFYTESVESQNSLSNDSEQVLVLEFRDMNIGNDTKLHFGFEYWDEELKRCFYGKAEYKLARDPKDPKEFIPTPFATGEADKDIRWLKEDAHCATFSTETTKVQK